FATRTRRLPTPPLFPYTPLFRSDSPGSPVARGSPLFAHRDETPRLLQAPVRAYTTPRAGLPSVIRRCQSGEPCGTRSIRKVDDDRPRRRVDRLHCLHRLGTGWGIEGWPPGI